MIGMKGGICQSRRLESAFEPVWLLALFWIRSRLWINVEIRFLLNFIVSTIFIALPIARTPFAAPDDVPSHRNSNLSIPIW